MANRSPLVTELIRRQEAEDLTGRDFAARLGCAEESWCRIRAGKQRIGLRLMRNAIRRYPNLAPLIVAE